MTCKWLRPYKIIKFISSYAFGREVLENMLLHNIAHITHFKLCKRQDEHQAIDVYAEEIQEV